MLSGCQPIQRLCKYPLILHELMKYTPSSDCPSSNEGIRQILDHLRILVARINSATGNPVNKDRIEKTLLLQEKIRFSEYVRNTYFSLRLLPLLKNIPTLGHASRYIQRTRAHGPLWCAFHNL